MTFAELLIGEQFRFSLDGSLLIKTGTRTYSAPQWGQEGNVVTEENADVLPISADASTYEAWASGSGAEVVNLMTVPGLDLDGDGQAADEIHGRLRQAFEAGAKASNYRELLRKYIDHVGDCEGVTFISMQHRRPGTFTEEEWAVLREIDGSSDENERLHDPAAAEVWEARLRREID